MSNSLSIKGKKELLKQLEDLFTALSKSPKVIGSIKHYSKETEELYIITRKIITTQINDQEVIVRFPRKLPNTMKNLNLFVIIFYLLSPFLLALILYSLQVGKEYAIIWGLYYPAFILLYYRYRGRLLGKQNQILVAVYELMEDVKKKYHNK